MGKADKGKTKDQLISELEKLRRRLRKMEKAQATGAGEDPSIPEELEPGDHEDRKPTRILIVDDSRVVRKALQLELVQAGFEAIPAASGQDGLKKIASGVDLVLLDLHMPDLDGMEVLKRVRADPATAALPVIMLTAMADLDNRIDAFTAGADDYLLKPYHATELLVRINRILKSKQILAQVQIESEQRRIAEEKLAKGKKLSQAVLRNLPDMIVVTGPDQSIRHVGPAIEHILGYPAPERIGRNIFSLLHPDDVEKARSLFQESLSRPGETIRAEMRALHRDGRWFHFEVTGQNLLGDPAVAGIVITGRDITARKQAEEALRTSEERYRDLIENSHDMICTHDLAGNLRSVNEAVARSLGYSQPALIKMNLRDLLVPKHRPQFEEYLATIAKHGQAEGIMQIQNARGETRRWEYHNTLRTNIAEPIVRGMAHDVTERLRAEAALRASEAKYRRHFVNASDTIYSLDRAGRILDMSPSVEKSLGYKPEELIGKNFGDLNLLAPASMKAAVNDTIRIFAGETVEAAEYEFIARDGSRRFGEVSGSPVVVGGEVVAAIAVARDITERKRAEDALKESEERYRELVEKITESIVVIQDGKMVFYNDKVLEITGYPREDYAKINFFDLLHPDDVRMVMERYQRRQKGDEVPSVYECRFWRRNGELRWIRIRANIIRWKGRPATLALLGDITARKQAEQRLRNEQTETLRLKTFLEAVMNNMMSGLVVTDPDGRVLVLNRSAREVFNLADDRVLEGRPIEDISPNLMVFRLMSGGHYDSHETLVNLSDGPTIPIGYTSSSLVDSEGGTTGIITVFRDLTEINEMRKELQEKEKFATIGRIAGGVAHEIKNPLFAISGGIQILKSELKLEPEQKETFDIIFKETMRVDRLIRELLYFGSPQKLIRIPVDLGEVINQVATLNQSLLKAKNLNLRLSGAALVPLISADRDRIVQVLINLLQNAIDASDPGGEISFDLALIKNGEFVRVAVRDHGRGILPEVSERVFEPFYSTKKGSSGMGLAITKKIVNDHGGDIGIESDQGRGVTIAFTLPVKEKA